MKIRRITIVVLIVLSLLFLADVRYGIFPGLRSTRRPSMNYQIGPGAREATFSGSYQFRHPKGNLTALAVQNQFGTIEIRRSDQAELVVTAIVKAFDPSVEEAEERIEGWEVEEEIRGSLVTYRWIAPTSQRENLQTDFAIEVPEGMAVRLEQDFGTIEATGLSGKVDIEATFSDVLVEGFVGHLTLESSYSTTNLRNILGPLTIDNSFSTLVATLVRDEAGYDFDVDLSFGTLLGNVSYATKEKELNEMRAWGRYGEGVHPVKIRSSFGSVDLSLTD